MATKGAKKGGTKKGVKKGGNGHPVKRPNTRTRTSIRK
jgi:hypothetical protein